MMKRPNNISDQQLIKLLNEATARIEQAIAMYKHLPSVENWKRLNDPELERLISEHSQLPNDGSQNPDQPQS